MTEERERSEVVSCFMCSCFQPKFTYFFNNIKTLKLYLGKLFIYNKNKNKNNIFTNTKELTVNFN